MNNEQAWTDLAKRYWPRISITRPADAAEWATELRETYSRNPPDNAELCRLVRWMSFKPTWQSDPPTLLDVRRALAAYRREVAEQTAAQSGDYERNDCAMCGGGGMIQHWPEIATPGASWAVLMASYYATIPCTCSTGRALYNRIYKGGDPNQARQFADAARRSVAIIAEANRQLPDTSGLTSTQIRELIMGAVHRDN